MRWSLGIFLVLVSLIGLSLFVRFMLDSLYIEFSTQPVECDLDAREVAVRILAEKGLGDIQVLQAGARFEDRYEPEEQSLWLSQPDSNSLSDVGIAAHEAWHAVQAEENGLLLRWGRRSANYLRLMGELSLPSMLAGFLFLPPLVWFGLGMYLCAAVTGLVSFALEVDADRQALRTLAGMDFVTRSEEEKLRKLLTFVALRRASSLITAPAQPILSVLETGCSYRG